jgi:hypothetical protein
MRVIIALIVVAVFLSLGGCSRNNQRAYAKPMPSAAPQYSTRASSEKPPTLPARKFAKARAPRPPSGSPSVSGLPPAIAKHYVAQDTVGNCAVVDSKPGAGLKIIGGYSSLEVANKALKNSKSKCKDVVGRGVLNDAVEQESEVKFKAAQAKAQKLGVHQLTQEDIEGLSSEQIKQLRGY